MEIIINQDIESSKSSIIYIGNIADGTYKNRVHISNNTQRPYVAVCLHNFVNSGYNDIKEAAKEAISPSFTKPYVSSTPYDIPKLSDIYIEKNRGSKLVLYDYRERTFTVPSNQ